MLLLLLFPIVHIAGEDINIIQTNINIIYNRSYKILYYYIIINNTF